MSRGLFFVCQNGGCAAHVRNASFHCSLEGAEETRGQSQGHDRDHQAIVIQRLRQQLAEVRETGRQEHVERGGPACVCRSGALGALEAQGSRTLDKNALACVDLTGSVHAARIQR